MCSAPNKTVLILNTICSKESTHILFWNTCVMCPVPEQQCSDFEHCGHINKHMCSVLEHPLRVRCVRLLRVYVNMAKFSE